MSLFKDYTGNLAGSKGKLLNAAAGAVGGLAGGLIGGGYETGLGSTLSGLGSIASTLPGPLGAGIGAGLQFLGGFANRAFGWKANKENIAQVQNITDQLNSFNSNAGDWDSYLVGLENMPSKMNFSNSFIGTNGWFNNKADDKANELRNNMNNAFASAMRSVQNNRNNIALTQAQNLRAVSAALGGPLTMRKGSLTPFGCRFDLGGGLHTDGGDWSNGLTFINEGKTHEQNPNDGVQMGVDPEGTPNLVEEGEVVWNDYVFSNRLRVPKAVREKYKLRGQKDLTFADAVKQIQKESEERPNDPISKRGLEDWMSKLANEQETVRQKKAQREINRQAASLGITPEEYMAMQQQDQGLMPMVATYGGGIHIKPSKRGTFTAAASKHNMGVQEFASEVLANKEDYSPAMVKKANFAKNAAGWKHGLGGNLFFDGSYMWTPIPWNYVPYREELEPGNFRLPGERLSFKNYPGGPNYGSQGYPEYMTDKNLFETPWGGELTPSVYRKEDDINAQFARQQEAANKWRDVSNRFEFLTRYKPTGQQMLSAVQKGIGFDPTLQLKPDTRSLEQRVTDEWTEQYINPIKNAPVLDNGNEDNTGERISTGTPGYDWETGLRYIPALGSAISVFSDLMGWTNKPDYSNADAILNASKGVKDVRFDPIGDYMAYNPFDRMFYLNQLNANSAANRRAIINASAGNRGAAISSLLASDYNTLNSIGQLGRQAEEYNLAQRQKVADFNRATNMFNSEGSLKAQQANQGAAEVRMRAAAEAAKLRDTIDARIGAAKSANLTNLFDSIGNIGWEAYNRNMVNSSNPLYGIGRDGKVFYKPEIKDYLSAEDWQTLMNTDPNSDVGKKLIEKAKRNFRRQEEFGDKWRSNGGYITIKGRRK